jgi:hypothetical protein
MNARNSLPPGGRDLRPPRTVILKWDVWPIAVVEVMPGQVGRFGGEYSLTVIDAAGQAGHVIPYDAQSLTKLRDDLNAVLEGNTNG